ncbi:MAG: GNAT family N-acetyltransferase [Pyrinomonadaceae bacterium]
MKTGYTITAESPYDPVSLELLDELSAILKKMTGSSGKRSVDLTDFTSPDAVFIVARNESGIPVGCGGIRRISARTGEIKRMYSKERGIGTEILKSLEKKAEELGYQALCLETRRINKAAISFYLKYGYRKIPNYGRYAGRPEAICFKKTLKPFRPG